MTLYIANDTAIPNSQFNCPAKDSGIDFVTIPWQNLNTTVFSSQNSDQFCGIKGPHPRMFECCKYGRLSPSIVPESQIVLAQDDCSQYCPYHIANLDLWLYCLTEDGNTVSNAFCVTSDGSHYQTSGSQPRNGPFNPDDDAIQSFKRRENTAPSTRISSWIIWGSLGAIFAALFQGL